MTYTRISTYRTIGDLHTTRVIALLTAKASPMVRAAAETNVAASPMSALFWAMGWVENQWETTGHIIKPEHHNPVSLRPWDADPRGLPPGATGTVTAPDGGRFLTFRSDADGAREWRYRLTNPAYKNGVYTKARTIEQMLAIYAPKGDVHPVTGLDNADIGYADTVARLLTQWEADIGPQDRIPEPAPQPTPAPTPSPPGGSTMASIKITRQMIPTTNPNFPGSLLNAGLLYLTVHETGNTRTGAFAQQEANFLKSGGGSSNVAFHFAVDHLGAFQCLPLNRIGWHAGDGCDSRAQDIGCFASVAIETCVGNNNQYKDATRANLLKLIAAIVSGDTQIDFGGTNPKRFSTQRIAPHKRWSSYSKECPTFMLRDGYMWTIIAKATALIADLIPTIPVKMFADASPIAELASYRSGDPNTIPYKVSLPDGTTCVFVGDRVKAVRETPRMRFSEGSEIVGPVVKAGEEFAVDWLLIHPDREDVYYSPWATRVLVKDTQRVSDVRDVIAA